MGLKEDLGKYEYWLGRSPGNVLLEVISVGGWKEVFNSNSFPEGLPRWAHRVRNYFNYEPTTLQLTKEVTRIETPSYLIVNWDTNKNFKTNMGLSGDAYVDALQHYWLQMSAGATVYHFKHKKSITEMAVIATAGGQRTVPVFKLICSDKTGGSWETIIKNPFKASNIFGVTTVPLRSSTVGEGEPINVMNLIEDDPAYQGSYNYSETSVAGFEAHERFDIKPHEHDEKGYINPKEGRHSSLFSRKFPEIATGEKTPLAEQIKYP